MKLKPTISQIASILGSKMDTTIVIIKPRAAAYQVPEEVLAFLQAKNLNIQERKQVVFNDERMRQFAPHVQEAHLPILLAYLNEDVNDALLVTGPNALALCLQLRDEIRKKHQTIQPYTLIHVSDSAEAVQREVQVLFENCAINNSV